MTWWDDGVLDPERWGTLVEPALERLQRAHRRGLFPHALLLVGPVGLGRELAAVQATAMLVCGDEPAGTLGCADRVRRGLHPDVVAVRPEPPSRQIKIEQVREVVEQVSGRPFEGRARVWILDGVESGRFGAEAANAFLKTLEEPPEHARFLLLAANPAAVLPTIRSRCQQLPLPGPVAVSRLLGGDLIPELTAAAVDPAVVGRLVEEVRRALEEALSGEVRWLVRLPQLAEEGVSLFDVGAAAALAMVDDERWRDRAADLLRLAAGLLAVERRARGLNLNRDRQLLSCLLRWHQDLDEPAADTS